MSLGEMKKRELLNVFLKAVNAGMAMLEADIAHNQAKEKGLQESDLDWVFDFLDKPEAFKKTFGENAIPAEMQERMKKLDEQAVAAGHKAELKGFYPA